jgi:hypothetical protein
MHLTHDMRKTGVMVVLAAALGVGASGCNPFAGQCDWIKPGDDARGVPRATGECPGFSGSLGSTLSGTCDDSSRTNWVCSSANPAANEYARKCEGKYWCWVQTDAQDKVACVRHFCQD